MVDPTRRKRLPLQSPPVLTLVTKPSVEEDWVVRSFHSLRPASLDLAEFAEGRGDVLKGTGSGAWAGGFRGRPELLRDLLPTLRRRCRQSTKSVLTQAVPASLRVFWRWLDTLDDVDGLRVDSLEDINDLHGAQFLRSGPAYGVYVAVKSYIADACQNQGLPPVFWPPPPEREFQPADLPAVASMRAAFSELKRNVFAAHNRWKTGAALAVAGKNWAGLPRAKTAAWLLEDVHATIRGIIRASEEPVPDRLTISQYIQKTEDSLRVVPVPWGPAKDLYASIYPSKFDVLNFLFLFLLRTGWNAQVALDLDVSTDDWARPHPTSPDHMLVQSVKTRGNTAQVFPSRIKGDSEPYNLVRTLVTATAPLRSKLQRELQEAEIRLSADQNSAKLLEAVAELRAAVRSPWLFFDSANIGTIKALSLDNYAYLDGKTGAWKAVVQGYNERTQADYQRLQATHPPESLKPPTLIPLTLKLSDLRDSFVSHAYTASGYSWLMGKLAAGHTSVRSLQHYLRQRQWRAHGEKQIRRIQDALWSEIRVHRKVEPAFLRALVERGTVTEEQRKRWLDHKDRTRMGTGCLDFTHPPPEIAPRHPAGSGCRVQRCILCRHAVVFADSLPALARRLAELEVLRGDLSMAAWAESAFADELAALDATLQEFPPAEVEAQRQHWHREIAEGRHRVLQFEGVYE